ncbi:MAG: hypothetical protein LBS71_02605 [Puniceicoccales bacterium]|nr:hypothetical protein [Puniceicoccales bacterium]
MEKDLRDKIVFVCTGNTCRSPMAQVFLENQIRDIPELIHYTVASAGIHAREGQESSPEVQTVMQKKGLSLKNHHAQLLTQAIIDHSAAIICATSAHKEFLKKNFANLPKVCISFSEFGGDVPDPYAGSLEIYGKIADAIEQKLIPIIEFLRKELDDY